MQAARLPALPAFPGSVEVGMAWMITEAARRSAGNALSGSRIRARLLICGFRPLSRAHG
jgi:hypothetical protein